MVKKVNGEGKEVTEPGSEDVYAIVSQDKYLSHIAFEKDPKSEMNSSGQLARALLDQLIKIGANPDKIQAVGMDSTVTNTGVNFVCASWLEHFLHRKINYLVCSLHLGKSS